jgi:hypothetical protein
MDRKQLEQLREGVDAQLRWAEIHGADQKLLELLRIHRDRVSAMIAHAQPIVPAGLRSVS